MCQQKGAQQDRVQPVGDSVWGRREGREQFVQPHGLALRPEDVSTHLFPHGLELRIVTPRRLREPPRPVLALEVQTGGGQHRLIHAPLGRIALDPQAGLVGGGKHPFDQRPARAGGGGRKRPADDQLVPDARSSVEHLLRDRGQELGDLEPRAHVLRFGAPEPRAVASRRFLAGIQKNPEVPLQEMLRFGHAQGQFAAGNPVVAQFRCVFGVPRPPHGGQLRNRGQQFAHLLRHRDDQVRPLTCRGHGSIAECLHLFLTRREAYRDLPRCARRGRSELAQLPGIVDVHHFEKPQGAPFKTVAPRDHRLRRKVPPNPIRQAERAPKLAVPFGNPVVDVDVAAFPDPVCLVERPEGQDRALPQRAESISQARRRLRLIGEGGRDDPLDRPEGTEVSQRAQHADGLHDSGMVFGKRILAIQHVGGFHPAPRLGLPEEAGAEVDGEVVEDAVEPHEFGLLAQLVRPKELLQSARLQAAEVGEQRPLVLREPAEDVRKCDQRHGVQGIGPEAQVLELGLAHPRRHDVSRGAPLRHIPYLRRQTARERASRLPLHRRRDHADDLVHRLQKGDVLKPPVDLGPFLPRNAVEMLPVVVERLVQESEKEKGKRPASARQFGDLLHGKHVAPLWRARGELEHLAQFVNQQQHTAVPDLLHPGGERGQKHRHAGVSAPVSIVHAAKTLVDLVGQRPGPRALERRQRRPEPFGQALCGGCAAGSDEHREKPRLVSVQRFELAAQVGCDGGGGLRKQFPRPGAVLALIAEQPRQEHRERGLSHPVRACDGPCAVRRLGAQPFRHPPQDVHAGGCYDVVVAGRRTSVVLLQVDRAEEAGADADAIGQRGAGIGHCLASPP